MVGVKEGSRISQMIQQLKKSGYPYPKDIKDSQDAATSSNSKQCLTRKESININELPYEGHCEEHRAPNHFKCIKCNKYICGTCVVLMHKSCPKVFPVLDALNLVKREKLKKIKLFKTKLEKESKILDAKLNHLTRKQGELYQEIEMVESEAKETKSKKEKILKLYEDSTCHEENLEKANGNEDYDKVDAETKCFFEENCIDILFPLLILSKEDALKLTKKDLEESTFYVMKSDGEKKKYAEVKVEDDQISFGEWEEEAKAGSFCVEFFDFISSRTSAIDSHKFINEHKEHLLHNPKLPNERIKFCKIEVKGKDVFFNSLEISGESDFVIEFTSVMKTLGYSSVLLAKAFLKVAFKGKY